MVLGTGATRSVQAVPTIETQAKRTAEPARHVVGEPTGKDHLVSQPVPPMVVAEAKHCTAVKPPAETLPVSLIGETRQDAEGTAAELFQVMAEKHSRLKTEAAALVAINDEMAGWDTPLADGDEVLFFPPVAGG